MVYKVYSLKCPFDNEIKYIGISINPELRLISHINEPQGTNEKALWTLKCFLYDKHPIVEIIEEIETDNKSEAYELERYWIEQFKQWGFNLLNGVYYKTNKRKGVKKEDYLLISKKEKQSFKRKYNKLIKQYENENN
jgi:predicted GIY-YIG superfamily endonuclease